MNVTSDAQRSAAKVAAAAFLISFALVVYANFGLRADLFAGNDMAASVRRIADAEAVSLALLASVSKLVYALTAVLLSLSFLTIVRLATDPALGQKLGGPRAGPAPSRGHVGPVLRRPRVLGVVVCSIRMAVAEVGLRSGRPGPVRHRLVHVVPALHRGLYRRPLLL